MKIIPVLHKAKLKDVDEDLQNLEYWISRPITERIEAVTQLRAANMKHGERMDKTFFTKRKMHL